MSVIEQIMKCFLKRIESPLILFLQFENYIFIVNYFLIPIKHYKDIDFPIYSYYIFYFEGFTSFPTALTANDRNRRIQVYQASDG